MNIGVNTLFHVPGDIGGTETYLRELLLAMVHEFPQLHLTLFTSNDNDALMKTLFAAHANVVTRRLPFSAAIRPLRIILEQVWLPLAVVGSNVDVLWSPGYTAPFWAPCPQVVTVHDLQYRSHPDDLSWLERQTLDKLVRMACKRCAKIIAVSGFSKREIVRHGFAPAERVEAVLAGVDSSFGTAVAYSDVAGELHALSTADRPYILAVAHTYPHKKVDLLVDAFALIHQEIPHNLIIVGKKRLGEPALQKAMDRLPCRDRLFRFAEGLTFSALKYLYQQADVFVLSSEYEGFGLPVLEAMTAGTPVVTSKMASIPEVAGAFACYYHRGDCASLGDAILQITRMTSAQRLDFCRRAQQWASGFSWRKTARETVSVLAECRKGEGQC